MDYSELFEALEELEKERGIPKEYMLQKIEAGLLAALRKDATSAETLAVLVDEDAKTIKLVTRRTVVEAIETPGAELTLEEAQLKQLGRLLAPYRCIERVQLLPFHKMGEYKWEALGEPYTLGDILPPDENAVDRARAILIDAGLPVR